MASSSPHVPLASLLAAALALIGLVSCAPSVARNGPAQSRVVSRAYHVDLESLRASILSRFEDRGTGLPSPFRRMRAIELQGANYPPDWLAGWRDDGDFLGPYKSIPGSLRLKDLLLEEPTGDVYWQSEYSTAGGPVKFRCGFILHFSRPARSTTEVQVYEKVPEIWAGERWDFLRHGIGFGKVHDIRFVEPTVSDRLNMLDLVADIAGAR